MSYQAEYIWIDGTEPSPLLRSKTKIVPDGKEPPIWGFDGSSTNQAATAAADPWSAIVAAFDAFLETLSDPVYQRLCWVEGPAALGFEEWWACGERFEIPVIRSQLERVAEAGVLLVEDLDMLAHVLFGAVTAGVLAMARAADPERERDRFRNVMLQVIHGMVRLEPFKEAGLGEAP